MRHLTKEIKKLNLVFLPLCKTIYMTLFGILIVTHGSGVIITWMCGIEDANWDCCLIVRLHKLYTKSHGNSQGDYGHPLKMFSAPPKIMTKWDLDKFWPFLMTKIWKFCLCMHFFTCVPLKMFSCTPFVPRILMLVPSIMPTSKFMQIR